MTEPQTFLIINPFGIGDVLFTTPVIKAIKLALPKSKIIYWCNERTAQVLKNNPHVDKVIAISRGDMKKIFRRSWISGIKAFFSLLNQLRKQRANVSLDFSLDHRYSLISKLCSIKRRVGFNYKGRGIFLTDKLDITGYSSKHVIEYYLELLKLINIPIAGSNMELFVNTASYEESGRHLNNLGASKTDLKIGIAPGGGASWGKDANLKLWPAQNYGLLADKLIDETKAKVILLGDPSEVHLSQLMRKIMKNAVIDQSGLTDLDQFISIIANLDILICNDGGPLHIAKALKVKTVSIFGPVDDLVYGPFPPSQNDIVIKCDLSCRPCYRNFRLQKCSTNRKCIEDITVERVLGAVKSLLRE